MNIFGMFSIFHPNSKSHEWDFVSLNLLRCKVCKHEVWADEEFEEWESIENIEPFEGIENIENIEKEIFIHNSSDSPFWPHCVKDEANRYVPSCKECIMMKALT